MKSTATGHHVAYPASLNKISATEYMESLQKAVAKALHAREKANAYAADALSPAAGRLMPPATAIVSLSTESASTKNKTKIKHQTKADAQDDIEEQAPEKKIAPLAARDQKPVDAYDLLIKAFPRQSTSKPIQNPAETETPNPFGPKRRKPKDQSNRESDAPATRRTSLRGWFTPEKDSTPVPPPEMRD